MAGISSKAANKLQNKYLFGEKEKQANEFNDGSGLELYDFEARFYDSQIGKWNCIDPLSENYLNFSPYVYCINNPLRFCDPNGMEVEEIEGGLKFTGDDAKSIILVATHKAKNIYFDINSKKSQRDEINDPDKKPAYGNWAVFAVESLYAVANVLNSLASADLSLENLVVSNHGGSKGGESMFGIYDRRTVRGEGDYISTSEIVSYNRKEGKDLTSGEKDVDFLKSILSHVKNNGNAILAFCFTGSGESGKTTIKELSKFAPDVNILLPEGKATLIYLKFNTGRAVKVDGTLSSKPGTGWLQINPNGSIKSVYDVVLNYNGTKSVNIIATKPK